MKERTILVKTLSKTYAMTGWRLGYLIADGSLIREMAKVQGFTILSISAAVQKAAVTALTGPQNFVKEMVDEFNARRMIVINRLNKMNNISCKLPEGAFYAFPNISKIGMKSYDFTELLLEKKKVAVYPGIGFGDHGEGHIRISYAASRERLKAGLDGLESLVSDL